MWCLAQPCASNFLPPQREITGTLARFGPGIVFDDKGRILISQSKSRQQKIESPQRHYVLVSHLVGTHFLDRVAGVSVEQTALKYSNHPTIQVQHKSSNTFESARFVDTVVVNVRAVVAVIRSH